MPWRRAGTTLLLILGLGAAWIPATVCRGGERAPQHGAEVAVDLDGATWRTLWGAATRDGAALRLAGGTRVIYEDFAFGQFIVTFQYRSGDQPATPVVYYHGHPSHDGTELCGSLVRLPHTGNRWRNAKIEVGRRATRITVEGRRTIRAHGVADPRGHLVLGAGGRGGHVLFRHIVVGETGFQSLFDGKSMDRWETADGQPATCWQVREGQLICTGQKGTWLRSRRQYGDFNLRLEYRLQPGGNSGVYVRVPDDGNHHGKNAGVEVQILDDTATRYAKLKPYQFSASLYAVTAARPGSARPAAQWNSLEVDARGSRYRVWQNGQLVLVTDANASPELAGRRLKGYLGLQNHNELVEFRRLRIGPAQ